MGTTLHTLAPNPGATRKRKRVGRGPGSGYGKTAGRGQKGQKSRAGHHGARVGFEGGQMPMQRRLPKRGFTNPFRVETHPVNLGALATKFGESQASEIDVEAMREAGLVPKKAKVVKVLANGDLTWAATVRAHRFSKSAQAKIEAAGGKAEIITLAGGDKPAKNDTPANATPAPEQSEAKSEAQPDSTSDDQG